MFLPLLTLLGTLLLPPAEKTSVPRICPDEFEAWFERAMEGRLDIPERVSETAARFRYVFVGGLHSQGAPGYFAQNARELRAAGVPRGSIHILKPSPHRTLLENAEPFEAELTELVALGPERLVIIGHSRGACDVLWFALHHPGFVTRHVYAMFLVQGPFGGSGLADYVSGDGPEIDGQMSPAPRILGRAAGKLQNSLASEGKQKAIGDLSRASAEKLWRRALKSQRDALPDVSPRVFYITSQASARHHPLLQRLTASYLAAYYGPNDGVVALEDQSLDGLGMVLAVLEAGHTDLTRRFPSAPARQRLRKALSDAILMAVGQQDAIARPGAVDDLAGEASD
jgi:pimeloyl-ACP methyl ester carboxylesterase